MNFSRPLAAGILVGVGLVGGTAATFAVTGSGGSTPAPATVEVRTLDAPAAPTTTEAIPVTTTQPDPAPVDPTPLSPPPMPAAGQPVVPVAGPYGPLYPDGYVAPNTPAAVAPTPPPPTLDPTEHIPDTSSTPGS